MTGIGDRMKEYYENPNRYYLTRRVPVIIRVDGKAFHTLTRGMNKPFDGDFINAMNQTAVEMMKQIQGCTACYVQSDEISFLLTDYTNLQTDAWFGYNKSKIESVSASMATYYFNQFLDTKGKVALFDSRAFNIPKEDVPNYFLWRLFDWNRNSLSMYARSFYSHEELFEMNANMIHEMLFDKQANWSKLPDSLKNGVLYVNREPVILGKRYTYEEMKELLDSSINPVGEINDGQT